MKLFILLLIMASAVMVAAQLDANCDKIILWGSQSSKVQNFLGFYDKISPYKGRPLYSLENVDGKTLYIGYKAGTSSWIVTDQSDIDSVDVGKEYASVTADVMAPQLTSGVWTWSERASANGSLPDPDLKASCSVGCPVALSGARRLHHEAVNDIYDPQKQFKNGRPMYLGRGVGDGNVDKIQMTIYFQQQDIYMPLWKIQSSDGVEIGRYKLNNPETSPTFDMAKGQNWMIAEGQDRKKENSANMRCLYETCFGYSCPGGWDYQTSSQTLHFDMPAGLSCNSSGCSKEDCCTDLKSNCGDGIVQLSEGEECEPKGMGCCGEDCRWRSQDNNITYVCRPAAGPCDAPEYCGKAIDCPDDKKLPRGAVCGAPYDLCAPPATCDGIADECAAVPPYVYRHSHHICRLQADECDLPERCTGKSEICPPDEWRADGTPCGGPHRTHKCIAGKCSKEKVPDPNEHTHGYDDLKVDHNHGPSHGLGAYRAAYPDHIHDPAGNHYHP